MTLTQHHLLALSLTTIFSTTLGIFVWLKNPRRWLNRLFALHSLAIAAWSATEPFSTMLATSEAMGMSWLRLEHVAVFLMPPLVFHLVAVLLELRSTQRFIRLGYSISFLFTCGVFSPLLLEKQMPKFYCPLWLVPGPLYHLTVAFFWIYVGSSLWYLWKGYRSSRGARRLQIKWFFIASLLGYLGGGSDYLMVYDIYVPWLNPYALYLVAVYKLITAYTIVQHHFLDIHVVIRKSLVYSLLVTLLTVSYFGLIHTIENVFQTTFGYQSLALSMFAFAMMALLFQPLKTVLQRAVDWLIFRKSQEQIAKKMERLEQAARQVEKLKAMGTLSAGLCHELRNPLQAIQTHAEFLPERYDDPGFRQRCSEVMRIEIGRINDLLRQLMDFAKPKSPSFRSVEPHRVIDSTLNLLSNDFLKRRIQLVKRYEANGNQIQADSDQLRQVILNLLLNALQAAPENGRITVSTREETGWYILEVSDTGPGIDPKVLPKLFEPFNSTKPDGTGLGLSIVHSIVQEHQGRIYAKSRPGQGATFTVQLPVD